MRRIIAVLPVLALFVFFSFQASAAMMDWDGDNALGDSGGMMQSIGNGIAEDDMQEMLTLMNKMMGGALAQDEVSRLSGLAAKYMSSMSFMMSGAREVTGAYGMMSWMGSGVGAFWMWVVGLSLIVWLGVGVLLFVRLWHQVVKK